MSLWERNPTMMGCYDEVKMRVTVARKPCMEIPENALHACSADNARTLRSATKCRLDKSTACCLSSQLLMCSVVLT